MNFKPELTKRVLSGMKTQTRRLTNENPRSPWFREECRFKVGRDYSVCPGRGKNAVGRIRILEVRQERIGNISQADAQAEGFPGREKFLDYFKQMHGSLDLDEKVWVLRFEVVR